MNISNEFYDDNDILSEYKDQIDEVSLYPVLNNTRTIKSKEELLCMREIC